MIDGLKPYGNYKSVQTREGHIPWLYTLPAHWSVSPSKWLFVQRQDRARPDDQQLSATQAYGVILQKEFERRVGRKVVQIVQHLDKRRHVECDDFVISMRSFQGGLERAWASGAIRSSYVVLKPTVGVDVGYFSHLFKSKDYISALQRTSNFVRDGQDLNFNNFRLVDLPVLPPEEQRAIAKFIDHADRRIRRYVRAKQKLIQLLEEQKQAELHEFISPAQGVATGNDWFPQIPNGWSLVTLGRLVRRIVDGPHHSPSYVDDGVPFISARNIKVDTWSLEDAKFISEADYAEFSKRVVPRVGDVLYTKGGTTGVARAVDLNFPFQVWVHVAVLKLLTDVNARYVAAVLNTPRCYEQSQLLTRGATNQDLGLGRMRGIWLPVPPADHQAAVADRLEQIASTTRARRVALLKQISLATEYRTRLIADVVTGKLDVREAAANLPDEADEDDLEIDDADESEDESDLPDTEDSE